METIKKHEETKENPMDDVVVDYGKMGELVSSFSIQEERGNISINGYDFKVRPVTNLEFDEFRETWSIFLRLHELEEKEGIETLPLFIAQSLFSLQEYKDGKLKKIKIGFCKKIYFGFCKKFYKDYRQYAPYPQAKKIAKWIETLVKINGKKVTLQDLELKYAATKEEIAQLFIYINRLSNFTIPQKKS